MWVDRGYYYEHSAPQGSEDWLKARIGRCNGSDSGSLSGQSRFDTAEQTGKYIAGIESKVFSDQSQEVMKHGHVTEPIARQWYENKYQCKVVERGLCIPKNIDIIGASVDGDILETDGILEIKAPKKMYKPILNYMNMKENGWLPPENYYDHIWNSHLCQMMQGMKVLNKKYCDYVVYSTEDSKIFVQRVHFDPVFWGNHYSILSKNYKTYVEPYLKGKPSHPNN